MSAQDINQLPLPDPALIYGAKEEIKNIRILKVGEGNKILLVDPEAFKMGGVTLDTAAIILNYDGTAKFTLPNGTVILNTGATDGDYISIINNALNTASKKILSDFTFEATDYAGAFKTGNVTWDDTTGLVTGGTGGVFNARGLLFASAGVPTITLDAVTGDATFAGTLSAAAGTLGAITLASGGNIKSGKTTYSDTANAGFFLGFDSGVAKFHMGSDATHFFKYDGTDITMMGGSLTGGLFQTSATGYRVVVDGTTNQVLFKNGATTESSIYNDASAKLTLDTLDSIVMRRSGVGYITYNYNAGRACMDIEVATEARIVNSVGTRIEVNNADVKVNKNLLPTSDNSIKLGDSGSRWSVGYFEDVVVDDLTVNSGCSGCAYIELNLLKEEQKDELFADQGNLTPEQKEKKNYTGFEVGTVLVWKHGELKESDIDACNCVTAVASKFGTPIVLGAETIKVVGKVKENQFLVTSPVKGHARAWNEVICGNPPMGAVIAQAMENKLTTGEGVIKAMIRKF